MKIDQKVRFVINSANCLVFEIRKVSTGNKHLILKLIFYYLSNWIKNHLHQCVSTFIRDQAKL